MMFSKILVANRGEIAIRIIRACRQMGIPTVAVHSDADQESLHVKIADESVCIGPATPSESYLNVASIMSAADITGADAVHPGYGFLAENGDFAKVCKQSNLTFIGPSEDNIRLMGNKIEARIAMEKVGVPVLPGREVKSADPEEIKRVATEVGYPLILKAAFGGGGRGMKIVENEDQLVKLVQLAKTEAGQSFGNDTLYMEKYVRNSRHVEFQVMADLKGNIVTLGERDCTVQRRHQKLIEEAPSPAISADKRQEMIGILNKALKKIHYSNVGTVEFLLDENGSLYFMEMNTRIQVEHPVTEMITGIDLIKQQIRLAAGEPLNLTQEDISMQGHSIECRINAEDPERFRPSIGTIAAYHVPGGFGVRVDSLLYDGYKILPFYDSLLAKVIVHGKDRHEAIKKMEAALSEMVVDGIQSNIPFHLKVMRHEQFIDGDIDTAFAQHITSCS